jgi:hypothetical protein
MAALRGIHAGTRVQNRPLTNRRPRRTQPGAPQRIASRLEPFKAIYEMLRSGVDAPKKQRHTARRVLARLVDEHAAMELSYSTVRDYVRKRRPQILAEVGKPLEQRYVPQHPPGGVLGLSGWGSAVRRALRQCQQRGQAGAVRALPAGERTRRHQPSSDCGVDSRNGSTTRRTSST